MCRFMPVVDPTYDNDALTLQVDRRTDGRHGGKTPRFGRYVHRGYVQNEALLTFIQFVY